MILKRKCKNVSEICDEYQILFIQVAVKWIKRSTYLNKSITATPKDIEF